jgi:hypothetical protein
MSGSAESSPSQSTAGRADGDGAFAIGAPGSDAVRGDWVIPGSVGEEAQAVT